MRFAATPATAPPSAGACARRLRRCRPVQSARSSDTRSVGSAHRARWPGWLATDRQDCAPDDCGATRPTQRLSAPSPGAGGAALPAPSRRVGREPIVTGSQLSYHEWRLACRFSFGLSQERVISVTVPRVAMPPAALPLLSYSRCLSSRLWCLPPPCRLNSPFTSPPYAPRSAPRRGVLGATAAQCAAVAPKTPRRGAYRCQVFFMPGLKG